MQEVLKKVALICQTSRGSLWEKELWTQDPRAGRLCPPALLHGDRSHSGFLLLSPIGGGSSTSSPHSCTQLTTPDGGGGDVPASPLQVGPPLRRILCCLLEDPVERSPKCLQQELLTGTSLAGFSAPPHQCFLGSLPHKVPPPHSLSLQKSSQRQSSSPDLR